MSKRIPTDEMFQHWNAAYKEAEQPWREGYDKVTYLIEKY